MQVEVPATRWSSSADLLTIWPFEPWSSNLGALQGALARTRACPSDIVTGMEPSRSAKGAMLGDHHLGDLVATPWAGALIALGARLARWAAEPNGTQLVVAITVPVRDFAAVLIACGWTLARPISIPGHPVEVAATVPRGTPVRLVTDHLVLADRYFDLQSDLDGYRVHVGASFWPLERVRYLTAAPDLPERRFGRQNVAIPGSLTQMTKQSQLSLARQCAPNTDLAILGTKSWLAEEMAGYVGWGDVSPADEIGSILLPDTDNAPTWATRIVAAQTLQELDLPKELVAVVLDGSSAIRWLAEIQSPVIVAVLDRRSPDESASENVMHIRTWSEPTSLDVIGWTPPLGVEALAFGLPL